jgi:hypothetical protein
VGVCVFIPLGASVPIQLPNATVFEFPEAVQLVALTDDQVIEVEVLAAIEVADSLSVGAAGGINFGVAVSVTELGADGPPRLLQVNMNVWVPTAVGVMVVLPLVANVPLQLPEAVQLVAPADDQLIVVELPTATEFDARDSVGAAGAAPEVTVRFTEPVAAVPNAFVQVNV